MSHNGLLVFSNEDAIRRWAVEVAEGRENFRHLVHEVGPEHVVLAFTIPVFRLWFESTKLAREMRSNTILIFRQQFVIFRHFDTRTKWATSFDNFQNLFVWVL